MANYYDYFKSTEGIIEEQYTVPYLDDFDTGNKLINTITLSTVHKLWTLSPVVEVDYRTTRFKNVSIFFKLTKCLTPIL